MGELKLPLLLHDDHSNGMELFRLHVPSSRKKKKKGAKVPLCSLPPQAHQW
jgi:hypothetical protein